MRKVSGFIGSAILLLTGAIAHAETFDLGSIVVTPNRVTEDAARASSAVTVISQDDIKKSNARTVAEVLARTEGVHVFNQGSAKNTTVDIRGYGDTAVRNVLVLVNGRRTNPADISGPDYLQIPLGMVDHIEVIRGGASVLYGDNATGGVINIITKQGNATPTATVFSEFGSYNAEKYGTEVAGAKDKLSYYVYSEYADSNGYRDNSQTSSKDGQTRISYALSEQVKFSVEGGYHRDHYGLPGGLSGAELITWGRRGSADPKNYGDTKDRFIKLSSEFVPFDENRECGTVFIDYSRRNRDSYGFYDYGIWGYEGTKRGIDTDTINVKHVWDRDVLGRGLKLTSGLDYYNDKNRIWGDGSASAGDDLTIRKQEHGFYTHAQYEALDRLFVDGGIRREDAKYTFAQYNSPRHLNQRPHDTVYSGGLKYEYAKGSNVFVNAQKTFRFLATDEWFSTYTGLNTDLRQQSGVEYKAGIKHNVDDMLELTATPFVINNRNEIFLDPTLGGGYGKNSNYDRTRRVGGDLGARLDMLRLLPSKMLSRWEVFTNYTYQHAEFVDGSFDGKFVPMVPQHLLTAGVDLGLPGGFMFNLSGHFTGSQYAINDTANATPRMKQYALVDARVSYAMKCGAEVYLGVNNVFDKKYYNYVVKSASGTNKDFFPAPERSWVAGMKYKF